MSRMLQVLSLVVLTTIAAAQGDGFEREGKPADRQKKDPAAAGPDAEQLYAAALADARKTGRKVLLHVHGPG